MSNNKKILKLLDKFKDKESAIEINELLIELEKTDPKEFYIIHGRLLELVKFRGKNNILKII